MCLGSIQLAKGQLYILGVEMAPGETLKSSRQLQKKKNTNSAWATTATYKTKNNQNSGGLQCQMSMVGDPSSCNYIMKPILIVMLIQILYLLFREEKKKRKKNMEGSVYPKCTL